MPLDVASPCASPCGLSNNVWQKRKKRKNSVYIRKDISARLPTISLPKHFERFFIKLNLCEKKIFRCCSYNFAKCNVSSPLNIVGRTLNKHMPSKDIFELLETLIYRWMKWPRLNFVKHIHNLQKLVKDRICYKNCSNFTRTDLILINFPKLFQYTQTTEVYQTFIS